MERKRSLYLKVAIAVVLLVTMNKFVLNNAIQSFAYRITAKPVTFLENKLRSKRIASLQHERDVLLGNIVSAEALERENDALRRQLRIGNRAEPVMVATKIFSLQRNTFISTVMIDKGSAAGLTTGMIVIAPGNILMGRIEEVFDDASRVILVDDPRLMISARVLGTSILAESKGALRDEAAINLIAHTETIVVGATIVTSGLDAFPEGLAIGAITSVERGENTLFQEVRSNLFFNPAQSPILFVFKP